MKIKISDSLFERFREAPDQTEEDILRKNWRSILCMSCAVCCCSDVIPITQGDFDGFYERLDLKMERREFAKLFLQDPDTNAVNYSIKTEEYGGRCMFLGREDRFECKVWDDRPKVCAEFFCWEMTNFEKWVNGEEQDVFDADALWEENFGKMLTQVVTASPLSFFPSSMAAYMKLRDNGQKPSFYEARPELFKKRAPENTQ